MAQQKLVIDETLLITVRGLARDGATDAQIAKALGISERTFYSYLKQYPKLKKWLDEGKKPANFMVENALFKKAIGCKTITTKVSKNKDGSETVVTTISEIPPDPLACIRWLVNRRPDRWQLNPGPATTDGDDLKSTLTEFWQALSNSEPAEGQDDEQP
jgi:hypothetical protein